MDRIIPFNKTKSNHLTLLVVTLAHLGIIGLSLISLQQTAQNFEDGGKDEGVINGYFVDNYQPITSQQEEQIDDINQLLDSLNQQAKQAELEQIEKQQQQAKQEAIQRAKQAALEEQLRQQKIAEEKRLQELAAQQEAERIKAEQQAKLQEQLELEQQKIKLEQERQAKAQQEAEAKARQQALEEQQAKQKQAEKIAREEAERQEALKKAAAEKARKIAEEKAKQAEIAKKNQQIEQGLSNLFDTTPRQGVDDSKFQQTDTLNKYKAAIKARIMRNFIAQPNFVGKSCQINVIIDSKGNLSNPRIVSGSNEICQSGLRAIITTGNVGAPPNSISKQIVGINIPIEFKL